MDENTQKQTLIFSDLLKVDIRIGEIIDAKCVEGSSKLIELTVDMGPEYGTVTIFTGMQKWYTPEDFAGKKFPFVANLEPKKMMGRESQGMILSADVDGAPKLLPLSLDLPNGTKLL